MRNHKLTHHQVVTDVDRTVRGILEGKFSIRKLRYKLQYLYAALMSEYNDSLKYDETSIGSLLRYKCCKVSTMLQRSLGMLTWSMNSWTRFKAMRMNTR